MGWEGKGPRGRRGKGRQVHRTANYISEGKKRAVRKNRKKVRRRARVRTCEKEKKGESESNEKGRRLKVRGMERRWEGVNGREDIEKKESNIRYPWNKKEDDTP